MTKLFGACRYWPLLMGTLIERGVFKSAPILPFI